MKIKEGFVLREVMGNFVVIAVGEQSKNFHGMVKLNKTAADIWSLIEKGCSEDEISKELLQKYDADGDKIAKDVSDTLRKMSEQGFIEL